MYAKCVVARGQMPNIVFADMVILSTPEEMRQWSISQGASSIGFVPTMGALHEGHLHLLNSSKADNDRTVLSIFVNPTQFNNPSDFDKYPRTFESDITLAESVGVDIVYAPVAAVMYPQGFDTSIDPGYMALGMEGEFRPGHFEGVCTVVVKLLNAVQPTRLYLGQKDYQQLAVLRHVTSDLNMAVETVAVATVRHTDGLAMSSRNVRLTPQHRKDAAVLFAALSKAKNAFEDGNNSASSLQHEVLAALEKVPTCKVEYVSIVDAANLQPVQIVEGPAVICVAAFFGDVRLIDNLVIDSSRH